MTIVGMILMQISEGMAVNELLAEYPHLTTLMFSLFKKPVNYHAIFCDVGFNN